MPILGLFRKLFVFWHFWGFRQKLINAPSQFDESSREEGDTNGFHNFISSSPAIFRAFEDHSPLQIGEKQPHFYIRKASIFIQQVRGPFSGINMKYFCNF